MMVLRCLTIIPLLIQITPKMVGKVISSLANGKATGLDGIGIKVLKAGSPVLSHYLSFLFSFSLRNFLCIANFPSFKMTITFYLKTSLVLEAVILPRQQYTKLKSLLLIV